MTAVERSHRMTVEEAWLAKLEAAAGSQGPDIAPGDAPTDRPATPDPMIDDSGRGAVTDTAPRPKPVISELGPSGARRVEPGVGGAESAELLASQPHHMIAVPGPGTAGDTVHRPETVIIPASSSGTRSVPSAATSDAPAAAPTAVVPPLDGAVLPAPAGGDSAAAAPADAARIVSATTAAPQRPSGGAAPETSVMITPSGRSTAPTAAARPRTPITPALPRPEVRPPARPRIEPEPAILGLSRHTRSRLGSRLFNLFFVFVFVLILVQMVVALLTP